MTTVRRTNKARAAGGAGPDEIDPAVFRRRLMAWYRLHARVLPWRETTDPYRIWVSEIMLQQTRVAAVVVHYKEFLRRFPTLIALSLASEADVLAAWSGLGYYRRARMLHKAAQFLMTERGGVLPITCDELRTLPGIGEYTGAAIASIAFGEGVAVVDGNVERVLLRLTGRREDNGAGMRSLVRRQAQRLMPVQRTVEAEPVESQAGRSAWTTQERLAIATAAHPAEPAGAARSPVGDEADHDPQGGSAAQAVRSNPAGDHNQAMMELGATICLPRAPLCLHCPVHSLCRTRGEHATVPRPAQLSRPAAYLLETRKNGDWAEVLLERRAPDASLMPGMFELPPLPLDAVQGREPVLRVRHAITGTNYYVQVFAASGKHVGKARQADAAVLREAVPASERDLTWVRSSRLPALPLTGLARKILQRLKVMDAPEIELLK
ncbi:MAG: A/G-specific adenine glycosylase [Acidobacteriota bacterium]|nr:A/G-specific adenine glycosylase [Acidobacteriota bacterium]